MALLVLDTDTISSILREQAPPTLIGLVANQSPALTFANVGELSRWFHVRHWGPRRLARARRTLARFSVLPYDRDVAECWGEMQAYAQFRGRKRPVNDTWIAACCIVRGLPLATLNTKDFTDFAEHEGLELVPVS